MSYHFSQNLLLRMPVSDPSGYLAEPRSFLDDPFFLAALRVASPGFYAILERQEFSEAKLSAKESNTLQKYINRYCFRPTPFGLFSSISLVEWTSQSQDDDPVPVFDVFVRTAMPWQTRLTNYLLDRALKELATLESNPSIYRVLNEYRFFRTGLDESGKQRDYQLQSIAFSRLLKDLITLGSKGCSRQKIVSQIMLSADCQPEEAEDYADFLIDSQMLLHRNRLPITGTDHLAQLAAALAEDPLKERLLNVLARQDHKVTTVNPGFVGQLENDLIQLLPEKDEPQDKLSFILKLNLPATGLEIQYQEHIREAISALELLTPGGASASMSQFITSFQQHFEGQTLPLLQALDPEAGIGYQQPDLEKNNPLLETLHIPYRSQPRHGESWTTAHSVLMEAWLRDRSADPVIRLQDADLERLSTAEKPEPLLGMSVLFRIQENKVFVENAGGINAPALMGRFTVADPKIAAAARSMALQLETQNPDLIFAELLHLSDTHTDNVNRRAAIYHYELPITAPSTLPVERQLHLADLYIKVVGNKVVLFSERHQKFVIPRLTSAYNHSLNKLPLFRFLADLPYQYGRSNLGLNLRQFFPGLQFYPRVEYKNAILSRATWIISEQRIAELQQEQKLRTDAFTRFSQTIRLPRFFSFAEGDQELVFDGQSPRDILFFLSCVAQKKEVVLKEFLTQGKVKQYNAYLLPDQPIDFPKPGRMQTAKAKVQRKYIPGSKWLYLKIYAPKIGVNRLLLRLFPLLKKRYNGQGIGQWFFVRYEDHAPHIRLRLQVNPDSINEILLAFKLKLEGRIQQHVIREFQIDVYSRELERYAAGGIENTERFFCSGSNLFIHFLKKAKMKADPGTYAFALYSTYQVIRTFINDRDEQIEFTLNSFQQFLPEFADKPIKVELDKKYRELTPGTMAAMQSDDPGLLSGSIKAGERFLDSLENIREHMAEKADPDYLRSIIHMHLNRIFTDEARKQEMICYYLLYKYLLSVKGRNKKNTLSNN